MDWATQEPPIRVIFNLEKYFGLFIYHLLSLFLITMLVYSRYSISNCAMNERMNQWMAYHSGIPYWIFIKWLLPTLKQYPSLWRGERQVLDSLCIHSFTYFSASGVSTWASDSSYTLFKKILSYLLISLGFPLFSTLVLLFGWIFLDTFPILLYETHIWYWYGLLP